jgi:hypothetical protein
MARSIHVSFAAERRSQSLAERRLRVSHATVRSTFQR